MAETLSDRLRDIVEALPLRPGLRILEIGCGPGAMAREMARRLGSRGHVLAIDRSATAIRQAEAGSADEIAASTLSFRRSDAETFVLDSDEPFDIAVAIRVGAFDGRHPKAGVLARAAIKAAPKPSGKLYIDGGDPLREVDLG